MRAFTLFVCSAVLALGGSAFLRPAPAGADRHGGHGKAAKHDLHDAMRRLWTDHVVWTRQFVVSELADLPDLDAATARLLRNQADIGSAFGEFFGAAAGDELTDLLTEHITIAAGLVAALEAGDTETAETAAAEWRENADAIAQFLSDLNPRRWPFEEMQTMLHEHLDLTTAEVAARLAQDWEADIAAFDEILTQALAMADMLTEGILHRGHRRR
jgi:hypothetical protein